MEDHEGFTHALSELSSLDLYNPEGSGHQPRKIEGRTFFWPIAFVRSLHFLGAINEEFELTPLGEQMAAADRAKAC